MDDENIQDKERFARYMKSKDIADFKIHFRGNYFVDLNFPLMQGKSLRNRKAEEEQDDGLHNRAVGHGSYLQCVGEKAG